MLNPSTSSNFREYRVIAENAPFHSAFSVKTHRITPRIRRKRIIQLILWIRCILPKAHNFTPNFRRQRLVKLRAFAENAKFDSAFSPKTLKTIRKRSHEDSAKFNSAFSATTLSLESRFRRKRGVIKNFEYLGEFNLKYIFENVGWTAFCIY